MKYFVRPSYVLIIVGLVLYSACKKDSTPATQSVATTIPKTIIDTDYSAAEDDATATFIVNDARVIADASVKNQDYYGPLKNRKILFSGCEVITWAKDTNTVDTCYINFGSSDCICNDGRKRRGEIMVYWPKLSGTYTQAYSDSANTITIAFKNYYLDDINLNGIRTLTNRGHDTVGYQNWSCTANIIMQYPTGHTATWISNQNGIIVEINGVLYYQITGNADGVDHTGYTYESAITSPLYSTLYPWYLGGCPYIESGITAITRENSSNTLSVNYGTLGTCDDLADATINSNTYRVILP